MAILKNDTEGDGSVPFLPQTRDKRRDLIHEVAQLGG
jgi:hypothetical protein